MKKLFLLLCVLFALGNCDAALAIDWLTPNEDTVAWDAVESPSGLARYGWASRQGHLADLYPCNIGDFTILSAMIWLDVADVLADLVADMLKPGRGRSQSLACRGSEGSSSAPCWSLGHDSAKRH